MSTQKTAFAAVLAINIAAIGVAQANFIESLNLKFDSGAIFSGMLTIDNSFATIAVSGTLKGYQFGTTGYIGGTATDSIDNLWGTENLTTAPNTFANYLVDGSGPGNYSNVIAFAYDYSQAINSINPNKALTFVDADMGYRGTVNQFNKIAHGSTPIVSLTPAVPEPEEWAMLLAGVPLIGWKIHRRQTKIASTVRWNGTFFR